MNMDGTFKAFTLVEDPLFTEQLQHLGDIKVLDDALSGLMWALSTKPFVYPILPGTHKLRVAKTHICQREDIIIPALRIWFIIKEEEETVQLLSIDIIEEI